MSYISRRAGGPGALGDLLNRSRPMVGVINPIVRPGASVVGAPQTIFGGMSRKGAVFTPKPISVVTGGKVNTRLGGGVYNPGSLPVNLFGASSRPKTGGGFFQTNIFGGLSPKPGQAAADAEANAVNAAYQGDTTGGSITQGGGGTGSGGGTYGSGGGGSGGGTTAPSDPGAAAEMTADPGSPTGRKLPGIAILAGVGLVAWYFMRKKGRR